MRVAINLEQLLHEAPGGIGRYTAELARLLPEVGGDEVLAFTARHPRRAVAAALAEHGLEHVQPVVLPLPRPVLYDVWHVLGLAGPRRWSRVLRGADVVHAPSAAVPPRDGKPLVVTLHDAAPLAMPDAFTRRGRWFHARGIAAAAKRADRVIAVSEFAAGELAALGRVPRDRIRVVPNGVDQTVASDDAVAATRTRLGLADRPYVLWAGVLQPRKNVTTLIEGFSRLVATVDLPHVLALAGPTGWMATPDGSAVRRLGDRVRFLGPVPGPEMPALFRGADVFALPSRHEGFGLPLLEAMAQGRAAVAADIPALREVGDRAARFVPPDDADAWADALGSLLLDTVARDELGARARRRAGRFSWEHCVAATHAVYEECASV